MTFGQRLRQARKAQGLTAAQLADYAGCSRASITCWESDPTLPSVTCLPGLCRALGMTADQMLGMTDAPA